MITPEKVVYTARAHTTGGRDGGMSKTSDGRLEVRLSISDGPGTGTNPEQLFAVGWSACFLSAIKIAASKMKVALPSDVAIDAEADLGPAGEGYAIGARLNVSLPGIEDATGHRLIEMAEKLCPYSRATHGNIPATVALV